LDDGGLLAVVVGNAAVTVVTSLEISAVLEGMQEALTIHE
jgi:hypothetical protein